MFPVNRQWKMSLMGLAAGLINRSVIRLDVLENIAQDLVGPLVGIDMGGDFRAVKIKHRLGFLLIGPEAALDHFFVDVVESVFLQGAALETIVYFGSIGTGEVKDATHVELGA